MMHGTQTSTPARTAPGRFLTLDGLRGLAALIVVAVHASEHFGSAGPRFGYLAVDLFFVLSGFVLSYAYDRRFADGMTNRQFMRLRIERLAPPLYPRLSAWYRRPNYSPGFKPAGRPFPCARHAQRRQPAVAHCCAER